MATVDNSNNNTNLYHLPPSSSSPIDAGIIRCICSSTEDDGFTIQCEKCFVWQHAFCVQINQFNIPDQYLCDVCSKKKRPKLSKRIQISKKKLKKLDNDEEPSSIKQLQTTGRTVKNRIVSRHVHSIFKEARERWIRRGENSNAFIVMDTLLFNSNTLVTNSNTKKKNGLFALKPITTNRYMMEVTGDIMLKSEYKFDPPNDFCYLGTPLSHVLFYPNLDLCIDTRQFGNKARYIRRSCHPNTDLRNILIHNSNEIHLGLFSKHTIEKGEEITIGWGWQKGHIAWKENIEYHRRRVDDNKVIDEEEERKKKFTIRNMLDRFEKEFGNCACLNKRRCLIEQMRTQCQDLVVPKNEKTQAAKIRRRRSKAINNHNYKQQNNSGLESMEENIDVDVTSNSPPTLNPVNTNGKSTPDDEDDDEDIIDIGDDDLPAIPPLKEPLLPALQQDEEEEEAGDLSSLSSLSSLSDDEHQKKDDNEHRIKRKKLSKQQQEIRKEPAPLPRKKLWVKNYLKNKQQQHDEDTNDNNVNNTVMDDNKENTNNVIDNSTMITSNDNEVVLYTKPQQQEHDDGELSDASDASTVLMDQDELSQAYNHTHAITQE